jgi:hypothetical protein
MIAGWAEDASATGDLRIARQEATRLAAAVRDADRHLRRMKAQLKELVDQLAPGTLKRYAARAIFRELQTLLA